MLKTETQPVSMEDVDSVDDEPGATRVRIGTDLDLDLVADLLELQARLLAKGDVVVPGNGRRVD